MEARLTPATVRQMRLVLFGAAVIGALIGLNNFILHVTTDPLADVHAYYDAGARLNAGLPLYEQPADTNAAAFYRYPPLLAIAFRPLALLPFPLAATLWETALAVCFAWTVWRLGSRPPVWLAFGILAMPIAWSLVVGQAQVLVTALLVVGAPWAVALATHVKLLPALVALYWLGRRDWRALGWFGAWCGILLVAQVALEPAATIAYLGFPNLAQVGEVNNLSIYAASPLLWAVLVVAAAVVTIRLAPTRYGWAAAVALAVLATPRLLAYQLSTLLAGFRRADDAEGNA
jgi:alpha-1,2-mannosyltransferase